MGEGGSGSGDEKLGGWAPTPVGWDATPIRPGVCTVKLPVESRLSVASLIYVGCHVGEEVGGECGWGGVDGGEGGRWRMRFGVGWGGAGREMWVGRGHSDRVGHSLWHGCRKSSVEGGGPWT